MVRASRSHAGRRPALALSLVAALVLCACSNRPAIAAKATVQTFFSAIQADNLPVVEDNFAQTAPAGFRDRVYRAAVAAQSDEAARRAVEIVRVDSPTIKGPSARVQVVFADGTSDVISLTREGERWKVVTSGRLG